MVLKKRFLAELVGTFWLVFGGCGSAVLAAKFPQTGIGFLGVAFAFGLSVFTMAYAVGHIRSTQRAAQDPLFLPVGGRCPSSGFSGSPR